MQKVPSVVAAGVVLALAAACSSSPAKPHAGSTSSTSPGANPTASSSSNPAATPSATGKPAPPPTPAAGHTVGTGPGSKPPGSPTGFTRAGTYTYDVTGTSTTRLGTQKQNAVETFAVDAPKATTQKTTQKDPQNSNRYQTLESRSTGLYLVDLDIQQGTGFNEDFKPVGTALYFPSNYAVGTSWKWTARSTDGKYMLSDTSKITSTASITIGGHAYPTVVVDSVLKFTGSGFDLTDNQRDWVSTAYALVLKEHLLTSGSVDGFNLKSDETRTLRSTTPSSA